MTTSYDELWRTAWGDLQRYGPVHRHIQEDLLRVVASLGVRSILDVGCGSGDNLARLAANGRYELAGSDVSEEALALARQRVPVSIRLLSLDIERQSLRERFDLVVSIQVVEHLADDVSALRNMAAMARRYMFTSTIGGRMRRSEVDIGHVRNYSRVELARKLELAGLEVLWIRGWGFPFYSPLYRSLGELLPGGPPTGDIGDAGRRVANALYQLYRLNIPDRGDVLSALARPAEGNR
jgi:2-polyprenyl-3-methyl-5-hydroxy-6-metoxy-1,4-benzoquinol methylase